MSQSREGAELDLGKVLLSPMQLPAYATGWLADSVPSLAYNIGHLKPRRIVPAEPDRIDELLPYPFTFKDDNGSMAYRLAYVDEASGRAHMTKGIAKSTESLIRSIRDATAPCGGCRWLVAPVCCERCLFSWLLHSYWEPKEDEE